MSTKLNGRLLQPIQHAQLTRSVGVVSFDGQPIQQKQLKVHGACKRNITLHPMIPPQEVSLFHTLSKRHLSKIREHAGRNEA